MSEDNKLNILYFEGSSMRELHDTMDGWQQKNRKRFLSMGIQKESEKFCCIALTNPSEVIIVDGDGWTSGDAGVRVRSHCLSVTIED